MNSDAVKNIVARALEQNSAFLQNSEDNRPQTVQRITLDLTTARDITNPYPINFPFKSVFIENGTDSTVSLFLRPVTKDDVQSFFRLGLRDAWSVDYQIPRAFLHWSAQPAKSIDLILFSNSQFFSGQQLHVSSGGVAISEGSTFTVTNPAIPAAAATLLFAINNLRKVSSFQNNTGASVFVGGATVTNAGTTRGVEVAAGQSFTWKNYAALYVYSPSAIVAGGLTMMEEV